MSEFWTELTMVVLRGKCWCENMATKWSRSRHHHKPLSKLMKKKDEKETLEPAFEIGRPSVNSDLFRFPTTKFVICQHKLITNRWMSVICILFWFYFFASWLFLISWWMNRRNAKHCPLSSCNYSIGRLIHLVKCWALSINAVNRDHFQSNFVSQNKPTINYPSKCPERWRYICIAISLGDSVACIKNIFIFIIICTRVT